MPIAISSFLLALFLAGCATTAERDGLPTGVTLLSSDQGYCSGPVEIEGNTDVVVDDGESSTVAVDDEDDIEWRCMSDYSRSTDELDCPDGTSYIRVTREAGDEAFNLECFGRT